MIIYAIKQSVDRYEIKIPKNFQNSIMCQIVLDVHNSEKDNHLLKWWQRCFILIISTSTIRNLQNILKLSIRKIGQICLRFCIQTRFLFDL